MHLHLFVRFEKSEAASGEILVLSFTVLHQVDCILSVLVFLHFDDRETCFFTHVLDHGNCICLILHQFGLF